MYKNIFFDLDGTLYDIDTKEFLRIYYYELEKKFQKLGIMNSTSLVDNGIKAMYDNDGSKSNYDAFWESINQKDFEHLLYDFYINEFHKCKNAMEPIGRTRNMILNLKKKGYRLFLLTNPLFPQIATYERIRHIGLYPSLFEYITTYENSRYTKPNLSYYQDVLDKFNLDPKETLMVGNDCMEDMCSMKLGIDCFLRLDSLINTQNLEINPTYKGTFNDLYKFLNKLPNLGLCYCGSGKKYESCCMKYQMKLSEYKDKKIGIPSFDMIKNPRDIMGIRKAGEINTKVLDYVEKNISIGMTTNEINEMVYKKTLELGGIPAPLNYLGFPKSVCTSINNQVCHGIPDETILRSGDIINVDCTTIYNGYFADSSRTFMIGFVKDEVKKFVNHTKEVLDLCIKNIKPYMRFGDIGGLITKFAHDKGYSVVRECTGHGVGNKFHEEPDVNHYGRYNTGMLIAPGMVFTIEPMLNMGRKEVFVDAFNDWTIYTDDDSLSCQFEYTVLVTNEGLEILSS